MDHSRGQPFLSFKDYMVRTYGAPLHRVPIDLGFGCPHRNPDGSGGCAFCPSHGARADFTVGRSGIEEQITAGVAFARKRYAAGRFMAYVQAFTGTFAPAPRQRELYDRILNAFPFDALSIGTRPDCLGPETLGVLNALRARTDVWVELGIQTSHDRTLARVNRRHDWAHSRDAAFRLARAGLRVAAHVIIGLPGETPADFSQTADALARLPIQGVKIHNLHVIRGTPLAREFERDPFPVLDERAYAACLIDFIRRLPPDVAIVRINTDTADSDLVAPRWRMSKGQFRNGVIAAMRNAGWRQGDMNPKAV